MRSNEDAVEMIEKAKDLLESACEMLKNAMNERNGMDYRNQMRDSRGRYSGRDWDSRDERMMRRDGDWDDMPRGRYGY
jgi:hypothetical protein